MTFSMWQIETGEWPRIIHTVDLKRRAAGMARSVCGEVALSSERWEIWNDESVAEELKRTFDTNWIRCAVCAQVEKEESGGNGSGGPLFVEAPGGQH